MRAPCLGAGRGVARSLRSPQAVGRMRGTARPAAGTHTRPRTRRAHRDDAAQGARTQRLAPHPATVGVSPLKKARGHRRHHADIRATAPSARRAIGDCRCFDGTGRPLEAQAGKGRPVPSACAPSVRRPRHVAQRFKVRCTNAKRTAGYRGLQVLRRYGAALGGAGRKGTTRAVSMHPKQASQDDP